jgi:adenylate cyclase class 2
MTLSDKEIEVKFLIHDLQRMEIRIKALGGKIVQPRVLEVNLRYDTPGGDLTKNQQVLRLRQDQHARLTYKGAAQMNQTVSVRQELEVEVSSFDETRRILEALGFQPYMIYEKYRTTYSVGGVLVTLDELPFGQFSEIEGPDAKTLQSVAESLWLDWTLRSRESYSSLFDRVKTIRNWDMPNLSFEAFNNLSVTHEDLGLQYADRE